MQIYGQLLKKGTIRNQLTVSTLLASYARIELGNLAYTPMVFDSISSPNTVIWNTMIRAYTQIVMTQKQRFFCTIKCFTTQYLTILTLSLSFSKHVLLSQPLKKPSKSTLTLSKGVLVWRFMPQTLFFVFMQFQATSNLHMVLFNQLPTRDIVSWNRMIDGYIKFGNVDMAHKIFQAMPEKNVIS